jgi:hypothetical protein
MSLKRDIKLIVEETADGMVKGGIANKLDVILANATSQAIEAIKTDLESVGIKILSIDRSYGTIRDMSPINFKIVYKDQYVTLNTSHRGYTYYIEEYPSMSGSTGGKTLVSKLEDVLSARKSLFKPMYGKELRDVIKRGKPASGH